MCNTVMIINGKTVDLMNLTPANMEFSRMFSGLCGVVRFNGYSFGWTVAKHSLLLSYITETLAYSYFGDKEKAKRLAKDALLHDLSESLTGDIIRPFKQLVSEIREMEGHIDSQIRAFYGLDNKMPDFVDLLDKQLAVIETYHLTRVYGQSLLDEGDAFHVESFNKLMLNTDVLDKFEYFVGDKRITYEKPTLDKPLSEQLIRTFLGASKCTFYEIMNMSKTEIINAGTMRLLELS